MADFFDQLGQSLGQDKKKSQIADFFDQISENEVKNSSYSDIAKDISKQVGLGLIEKFTWPLDVMKSLALIGSEKPFIFEDPAVQEQAREVTKQIYDYFPTQELAEKFISDQTGIKFSPQTEPGKYTRKISSIYSTLRGKLIPKNAKELAKKGGGALAGAGAETGLEKLGIPEPYARIGGSITAAALSKGKTSEKILSPETKELQNIAKKNELPFPKGMQVERKPIVTPYVSQGKQKELKKTFDEASRKAIDKAIEKKIPIKKLKDQGIDLEDAYTHLYQKNLQEAKRFDALNAFNKSKGKKTAEINLKPVLNYIKKEISQIKKSAPSLSNIDKVRLKLLNREYRALTQPPAPPPKTQLLSPSGQPLTTSSNKRRVKPISAEQTLDQIKNYNENVKGIYRKPEFSGSEEAVISTYAGLKDEFIKTLERSNPVIAKDLRTANKIFHETHKLERVEGIFNKSFKDGFDPKKLEQTLDRKGTGKFLERDLGKGTVQDLKDIARYGKEAEKTIFQKLENPKTVGELIKNITPFQAAITVATKFTPKLPLWDIPLAVARRAQGYLFTQEGTRKSYINYLKAVSSGRAEYMRQAGRILDEDIRKEFGSEEELLKLSEE